MNNTIIFPATRDNVSVINIYAKMHPNETVIAATVPTQYSSEFNSDVSDIINEKNANITLINNLESKLPKANKLIILKSQINEYLTDYISEVASRNNNNIEIVTTDASLADVVSMYKIGFVDDKEIIEDVMNDKISSMYNTVAPIVAVGTIENKLDNVRTLGYFMYSLKQLGISCACITTDINAAVFDAVIVPEYFNSTRFTSTQRVQYINQVIRSVEESRHPDVIIVDMQEPLLKYSADVNEGFGITPYIISQAIDEIDYSILTMSPDFFDPKILENILLKIKYRFGLDINQISVVNRVLDESEINELHRINTIDISNSELHTCINEFPADMPDNSINLFNPYELSNLDSGQLLLNTISNYKSHI